MKGPFLSSFRVRLLLLVLLAVIPSLALTLYNGFEQRQHAAHHAQEEALGLARLASSGQERMVNGVRQFLHTLAQLPQVRSGDKIACSTLFSTLQKQYPHYLNIGAAELDGDVFASAAPLVQKVNIADRPYFRRALKTHNFSVGEYQIGRIVGKPTVNLGYPVFAQTGEIRAIVFVALDLTWLNQLISQVHLPEGSTLTLIDHGSKILAAYPNLEKWIGKTIPESSLLKTILAQGEGITEMKGLDGVWRLYAFTSFGGVPKQDEKIYVSIGIPTSIVFAQANRVLTRNLLWIGFVSLLALVASWVVGDLLLLRQVNALLDATNRVSAGDLSARTGIPYEGGELNQLARAFDDMAGSLQTREGERKQSEEALQTSKEEAQRLAQENAIMADIGRIIHSSLNIDDVYEGFSEEVRKLIRFDRISIDIVNPDDCTYTIAYSTGTDVADRRKGDTIPLANTIAEKTIRTRSVCIIQGANAEDLKNQFPGISPVVPDKFRSIMTVPLFSKDRVIAVLAFPSNQPNAYTEKDLRLAERIGNQIAGAIANAQLYAGLKRVEDSLKRSEEGARQIAQGNALVAEIGRIISSSLNIEEVYEHFAEKVRELIPFDRIAINTFNPDTQTITYLYVMGTNIPDRQFGNTVSLEPGSATGECIRTRSNLLIQIGDINELSHRFSRLLTSFKAGLRSMIFIPLISKDQGIGVLSLRSKRMNAYTQQDVKLAERVGNQIAGAIANTQLFGDRKRAEEALRRSEEEAKRLAQENATMAEIGRIIGSTLEIKEVYDHFAEEVHELIPFDRISISIINLEEQTTTVAYAAGVEIPERSHGRPIPLAATFTEELVRTRKSQLIQGDSKEIISRFPGLRFSLQAELRSMLSIPLILKNEVIGVLHLRSQKEHAYTDRDLMLAERVGHQIAGAIANAQLFSERLRAEQKARSLEEQLLQAQKMEAVGRLAGGIAHDFNNLMTVVKGYSQLSLLTLKEGDPLNSYLEEIQRAADRAANLTHQLLAFSRRQVLEFKVLDLNTILRNIDKMLHRIIGEDIEMSYQWSQDLGKIKTDPVQIEQVILNLAVNARDAMPSGGKLTIATANVELNDALISTQPQVGNEPGRHVMLSVSDTGFGMSREIKEHLFEPFFTTKEIGKGTGLGLSTVYGIIKQSGGHITVYSEPGKGTTFTIYLPRVESEEEAIPLPCQDGKEPQPQLVDKGFLPEGKETVLLVEDEGAVRRIAVRVLREKGYTLLEAANGEEALRIVQEQIHERIHLLLTDVVMPQMGGKELAQKIKILQPEIKVLFISGYTDNTFVHQGGGKNDIDFLQKPFAPIALVQKVREVLDK